MMRARTVVLSLALLAAPVAWFAGSRAISSPVAEVAATRALAASSGVKASKADVRLTLGLPAGTIATFTGINMGPMPVQAGDAPAGRRPPPDPGARMELAALYRARGLQLVRTHDFNGAFDLVDIPNGLQATRRVDDGIRGQGFDLYLRLGNSYRNSQVSANIDTIVADMLTMLRTVTASHPDRPVRTVEVWNEPDNQQFWQRSMEEYTALYIAAARAIRAEFPSIRIGGLALTPAGAKTPRGQDTVRSFFAEVKAAGVPLDFVTWHMYANEPSAFLEAAEFYRDEAQKAGFGDLEQHVTEWNTAYRSPKDGGGGGQAAGRGQGGNGPPDGRGQRGTRGAGERGQGGRGQGGRGQSGRGQGGDPRPDSSDPEARIGAKASALTTGAWIAMQQGGVDQAFFYRGPDPQPYPSPFYGMFYSDGVAKPSGYAALLWKQMMDHSTARLLAGEDIGPVWALAGQNADGEVALLLANAEEGSHTWSLGDVAASGAIRVQRLRAPATSIEESTLSSLGGTLEGYEVALVTFTAKP